MNEFNTKTHALDYSSDSASTDLEQLLTSGLSRKELTPLVQHKVVLAVAQFAQRASISSAAGDDVLAVANELCSRHGALAIPLAPELCTLMARVGFDKALFTYGVADGVPVGFAEAMWLLNFIDVIAKGAPKQREEPWLPACARSGAGRSDFSTSFTSSTT